MGIPATAYPAAMDSCQGRAIVVGGAMCLWDDLRRVRWRCEVICVNDIAMHFRGPVNHLYSNNHNYLPKWKAARRDQLVRKWGPVVTTHSCQKGGEVTWPWPGHGTSALGAVYTALALGYEQITLVGVPLDDSPHYFEPHWLEKGTVTFSKQVPEDVKGVPKYWHHAAQNVFQGRVHSLSGRTRELLGEP